jgi:hypothetical protein
MKHDLNNDPVVYGTPESGFTIDMYIQGYTPAPGPSDKTRYLYSLSPLEIAVDGNVHFIPERCAVKVDPGNEVGINMEDTNEALMVTLHEDELSYLRKLNDDHKDFFALLEGKDAKEWSYVSSLLNSPFPGIDFISDDEKNSEHIKEQPWGIIAPAHSRRNDMSPNGWHLMYARGSVALGVGTDYLFHLRAEEAPHKHGITVEAYVGLGGKMDFEVDGETIRLEKYGVLIAEPGNVHAMKKIVVPPYAGVTLQFPSIPGDKYTPEGERMPR